MTESSESRKRRQQKLIDYENSVLEVIGWQCQCGCKRKVGNYPRTEFHWDHIDPSTKIDGIANMRKNIVPLPVFIAELAKCQFLYVDCHNKIRSAQSAGKLIDYRLPKLQRDWDMFPINDTVSAKMNALSEYQNPYSIEMYDRWIECVPEDIDVTYEEWCTFGWSRTMLEGVWFCHRDMHGKLLGAWRKTDGAEVEVHWRDGVRLRQSQQVH